MFRYRDRFNRTKFICVFVGLIGSFLSVSGQTNPKRALVRYRLSLEHLPSYDSLQENYLFESNQFDTVLMNKEIVMEKSYNRYMNAPRNCSTGKFNDPLVDSLKSMQYELVKSEKDFDSILRKKQFLHDELLVESFQQFSLEFGKTRSLDLLLDAEPLYSKEPVVDLTNEFILFLEEY